ncbi:putative U4/U6 small nuclear ribonucleoprotein Prp4 [Blattamonas nauphoetae]|uniref:U4/U6 small nuclear ribonucleoprotein Prp4 n=1 Tax=Blattamonas nauphoetae TaxID=2049346 RepID=A0ABQ9Y6A1_9EUKA|nr:putative U4/U6 small nuclear ribonucleoprotein Prp4 [Blattamonas nauphoetae]
MEIDRQSTDDAISTGTYVPTDENLVRDGLRALGEPWKLFGEQPKERWDRLKRLVQKARISHSGIVFPWDEQKTTQSSTLRHGQSAPPEILRQVRLFIAQDSTQRSILRHQASVTQDQSSKETIVRSLVERTVNTLTHLQKYTTLSSQPDDDRWIACCSFSPANSDGESEQLLTASRSGKVTVWSLPEAKKLISYPLPKQGGHGAQIVCHTLVWNHHNKNQTENGIDFVSGYGDGRVSFWNRSAPGNTPLRTFSCHNRRVNDLSFHPHIPSLFFSCGYDQTWKMFDLEYSSGNPYPLIVQPGHVDAVHCMHLHSDGALLATGGCDSNVLLWDLRTGSEIASLLGHVGKVFSVKFTPSSSHNPYLLATAGGDCTIRMWDIRMIGSPSVTESKPSRQQQSKGCIDIVPAHKKDITTLQFEPSNGDFLLSASLDQSMVVWNTHTMVPVKFLEGHSEGILGADISANSRFLASVSLDKTVKLWGHRSEAFSDLFLEKASAVGTGTVGHFDSREEEIEAQHQRLVERLEKEEADDNMLRDDSSDESASDEHDGKTVAANDEGFT